MRRATPAIIAFSARAHPNLRPYHSLNSLLLGIEARQQHTSHLLIFPALSPSRYWCLPLVQLLLRVQAAIVLALALAEVSKYGMTDVRRASSYVTGGYFVIGPSPFRWICRGTSYIAYLVVPGLQHSPSPYWTEVFTAYAQDLGLCQASTSFAATLYQRSRPVSPDIDMMRVVHTI